MTTGDELVLTPPAPVAVVPPRRQRASCRSTTGRRRSSQRASTASSVSWWRSTRTAPSSASKVEQLMQPGPTRDRRGRRALESLPRAAGQGHGRGVATWAPISPRCAAPIEDLDPGKQGNLLAPKKLFGVLPFGNKMRDYFDGYKSAQSHIATILTRLASGKDELLKDNAAIDVERQALWAAMQRLEQMIHIAQGARQRARSKGRGARHTRSRPRPRRCARTRCSTCASAPPTCSRRWRSRCRATSRSTW